MMLNSSEQCIPRFQVGEWGDLPLPAYIEFAEEDQVLLDKLRGKENGKIIIDELKSGIRLRCRSWVGMIRFKNFEVQIVPKLAGSDVNIIKMFTYSLELKNITILKTLNDVTNENRSLLEIIALMFLEECEKLVRKGLLKDYVEHEGSLPYIRGRLLIDKQVLTRFGRLDSLECRYDERTADINENRLVYIALGFVVHHLTSSGLLQKIRRLHRLFGEICDTSSVDLQTLRNSISYNRRNDHYREAHRLANLLLDSLGISDMYEGNSSCYAFLIDMNRLFEAFVGKWLSKVASGSSCKLEEQRRYKAVIWDAERENSYSSVIPDFILTESATDETYLVVDAKYKLYDNRRLSSADIYQTFTYAYALAGESGTHPPRAVLIYPTSHRDGSSVKTLCIRKNSGIKGANVIALGVNIQLMLDYLDNGPSPTSFTENDQLLQKMLNISH